MTSIGIQSTSYGRSSLAALYDIFLGKLKDKIPTITVPYGIPDEVEPFYTAAFPKSYSQFPAVCMSIDDDRQQEAAIGRMLGGRDHGDLSGVRKTTRIVLDIWAKNSLELEILATSVTSVLNRYKKDFYDLGIIDYVIKKSVPRPYDPNAPRMWFGSEQAPGETWLRAINIDVDWFDTWSRTDEVYEIKRIDIDGIYDVSVTIGALTMGLLDTMYYERYLKKGIMLPRIKRGR